MGSWVLLAFTREPVTAELAPRQTHREFFSNLPALLRSDANLRGFLLARVLMVSGGLGSGFLMVSATSRWHVADAVAGDYTAVMMAGQVLGNLLCGVMSDRHGGTKITSWQSGVACSAAAYAPWPRRRPRPDKYPPSSSCSAWTAARSSSPGILMILELASPERRPTYVGLVNTSLGVMGSSAPGRRGVGQAGFGWLFATARCCRRRACWS
ncbi:MAG: hypothetical protein M5U09_18420 [Gammaproteobacteria bacterium]|nr:hypothetical protein [Gammaproteobacteria bacterium]